MHKFGTRKDEENREDLYANYGREKVALGTGIRFVFCHYNTFVLKSCDLNPLGLVNQTKCQHYGNALLLKNGYGLHHFFKLRVLLFQNFTTVCNGIL